MRKNKTGGRRHFMQIVIESAKTKDGKLNPRAGKVKQIKHQLVPKEPPASNLWGLK